MCYVVSRSRYMRKSFWSSHAKAIVLRTPPMTDARSILESSGLHAWRCHLISLYNLLIWTSHFQKLVSQNSSQAIMMYTICARFLLTSLALMTAQANFGVRSQTFQPFHWPHALSHQLELILTLFKKLSTWTVKHPATSKKMTALVIALGKAFH